MKHIRFTWRLLLCFFIIIAVSLGGAMVALNIKMREVTDRNYKESLRSTTKLFNSNIETALDLCERLGFSISGNQELNGLLLQQKSGGGEGFFLSREISSKLESVIISHQKYIRSTILLTTEGNTYGSNYLDHTGSLQAWLSDLDPYAYSASVNGGMRWHYMRADSSDDKTYLVLIGVIKNIKQVYKNETIALYAIVFRDELLSALSSGMELGSNGLLTLVDLSGEKPVCFASNSAFPDETLNLILDRLPSEGDVFEHDQYIVSSIAMDKADWQILAIMDRSGIDTQLRELNLICIIIAAAMMLLSTLISLLISTGITHPIQQLMARVNRVDKGDLSVRFDLARGDEFGRLGIGIQNMLDSVKRLLQEIGEAKEAERDAQLLALQAQINPHFLYNTLDAIHWCVLLGETEQASEMIACLGDILRYSIRSDVESVYVCDEVDQVRSYLAIQKMRLGDDITYTMEIPAALQQYRVLRFFLQPIVENAIRHGIQPASHPGHVRVDAEMEGDVLVFTVHDNGVGIPPDKLDALLAESAHSNTGIGLRSVRNRIRLLYRDERYGLSIRSDASGTTVRVVLPVCL